MLCTYRYLFYSTSSQSKILHKYLLKERERQQENSHQVLVMFFIFFKVMNSFNRDVSDNVTEGTWCPDCLWWRWWYSPPYRLQGFVDWSWNHIQICVTLAEILSSNSWKLQQAYSYFSCLAFERESTAPHPPLSIILSNNDTGIICKHLSPIASF